MKSEKKWTSQTRNWKLEDNHLVPLMSNTVAAPSNLLKGTMSLLQPTSNSVVTGCLGIKTAEYSASKNHVILSVQNLKCILHRVLLHFFLFFRGTLYAKKCLSCLVDAAYDSVASCTIQLVRQ